ncbi:MAG: hypothetical protein HRU14_07355 [Planctomycetes bacterium]|nr:hypothetical protein [Planctomycetota bacterium]
MRTLTVLLFTLARGSPAQVNPMAGSAPTVAVGPGAAGLPESALDVAVNRSGDGVIVWRQRLTAPPSATYQLWAQRLRRGAPIGAVNPIATTLDSFTSNELLTVHCAIDEEGNWAAVWDDTDTVNGNMVVRGRRYHAATGQLGPIIVASDGPGNQHRWLPDVAIGRFPGNADPHWYVVWNYATAAGQSTIRMRNYRVDTSGPAATDVPSPVIGVNSEPTGSFEGQDRPAITIDDQGTLTIVWEKYAVWGPGSPYWRVMLRRRSAGSWLPVYDPIAIGANSTTGLDNTDWEVSGLGDPAATSSPNTPPKVDAAPDGRVLVGWKRNSGAPYGFRILEPTTPGATPGPILAHLPLIWSPGHRRFDVAFTNEGSILLAWEHLATTVSSGRVMLSRISPTGPSWEEFTADPTSGTAISSVTVAASDTGQVQIAWARGLGPTFQTASRRMVGLELLSLAPGAGPSQLSAAVPGAGGLDFQVWPMSAGGTPAQYAATQIGDGRAADALLTDPLLAWHLAQGGVHGVLPNATGALATNGTATVDVWLPPGVGPVSVTWALLVIDPARPWPQTLRLFTQPRAIVVN